VGRGFAPDRRPVLNCIPPGFERPDLVENLHDLLGSLTQRRRGHEVARLAGLLHFRAQRAQNHRDLIPEQTERITDLVVAHANSRYWSTTLVRRTE
jgi:hypothetical protein